MICFILVVFFGEIFRWFFQYLLISTVKELIFFLQNHALFVQFQVSTVAEGSFCSN